MSKVVKFGGSSLADAGQFRKVADIIKSDSERCYVVPSAPGKRFSDDTKVTDLLYQCYEKVLTGEDFAKAFQPARERFDGIISDLGLDLSLEDEYVKIGKDFRGGANRDYAASRGEYLNGIILANYLGYEFVDAAKGIFFDHDGKFDADVTNACLSAILERIPRAVVPGFYGAMPDGSDLGTEYETPFYSSTIYNIINTRLNSDKPTIVSTNLDHAGIEKRYDERVVSRLCAVYTCLEFKGEDVRLQKRKSCQ